MKSPQNCPVNIAGEGAGTLIGFSADATGTKTTRARTAATNTIFSRMLNPFELEETWLSDWHGNSGSRLVSGVEMVSGRRNRLHDTGGKPKPLLPCAAEYKGRSILSSPQEKHNPSGEPACSRYQPPDAAALERSVDPLLRPHR